LSKATVALEQAQRNSWVAEDALEAAGQALVEARVVAGTAVADALLAGNAPNGHAVLREARQARDQAEDSLAAAQSAVKLIEGLLPDRTKTLESAESAVRLAARAVIKAESPDLTAELKTAIDRVHQLRASLYWLYRQRLTSHPRQRCQ
jgi:hypothetical protein